MKKSVIILVLTAYFTILTSSVYSQDIASQRIVTGLSQPIFATAPANRPYDLFVVERAGEIEILNLITRELNPQPFIQIPNVITGSERGLLGLAFDPNYASNRYFYVYLSSSPDGDSEIHRYQASAGDPDFADPNTKQVILTFAQPAGNHNGGWIGFGPDGYLYIASGDGGGGNDIGPGHTTGTGNAQDITDNLLGKMLRIDVHGDDFPGDANANYAIPPDNPFVGVTGDDEIWAYGLRNPWRDSFDRDTGDLYIADVGQSASEEINFQPAASIGGENYGWRVMEGTLCNFPDDPIPCDDPSFTEPIFEYGHTGPPSGGGSLTGGYVYRGPYQALAAENRYFFADFSSDQVWSFRYDGATLSDYTNHTAELTPDAGTIGNIASFAEDANGNLYILDLYDGEIFQVIPSPVLSADFTRDGNVDAGDLDVFYRVWLSLGCGYCAGFDTNNDNTVTLPDFADFALNWLISP